MKFKRFKIGETEKAILKAIGIGLVATTILSAVVIFPTLPMALQPFFKRRGLEQFKKTMKKLKRKGVIYLGEDEIKLTRRGKELLKLIEISKIQIDRPKQWDRVWYLVSYDIPDIKKRQRDWFRETLKRMEFEQIQESLWVHPFECAQEIAVISQNLGISLFVVVMTAKTIPQEEKVKSIFGLK